MKTREKTQGASNGCPVEISKSVHRGRKELKWRGEILKSKKENKASLATTRKKKEN